MDVTVVTNAVKHVIKEEDMLAREKDCVFMIGRENENLGLDWLGRLP